MALEDIANSTIGTDGAGLTQVGFGLILLVDYHTKFAERARYYTELSEMATDGFSSGDPLYKMATVAFSQKVRPEKVLVGRLATTYTQTIKWVPTITTQGYVQTLTIEIDGEILTATYTTGAAATVATIITAMRTAVQALDDFDTKITVTDATTYMQIATSAGKVAHYSDWTGTFEDVTANTNSIATELDAIKLYNNDWYGVCHPLPAKLIQQPIAAWVEANKKLFAGRTADWLAPDAGSTTDIGDVCMGLSYSRSTFYPRKHASGDYIDVGAMAERFPHDPGTGPGAGGTWFGKTIVGVAADDWTPTEKTNLRAKNYSVYISTAKRSHTLDGKVASGEFVDKIRFLDWTNTRIEEFITQAELDAERIPFTDPGITQIGKEVQAVLDIGVQAGGFAEDPYPTVTLPKRANLSDADVKARHLKGLKWAGTLAGAIHLTDVTGTVS